MRNTGNRRIHAALVRGGEQCSPELVRGLMRELGLEPCQPKLWRRSLIGQGAVGPIADLVCRDFTADEPGQKMVGDITYIPAWEGWLYLATVLDCATRKIVGRATNDNDKTPLIKESQERFRGRLELRYIQTRLHSALGYWTPQETLDEYLNGQEAA